MDGVVQAPGGPEEGFKYGGWSAPYYDEVLDKIAEKKATGEGSAFGPKNL